MKNNYLALLSFLFFSACGYKAPPDPFFATSPSNVQKEIDARKPKKEPNTSENSQQETQTNKN